MCGCTMVHSVTVAMCVLRAETVDIETVNRAFAARERADTVWAAAFDAYGAACLGNDDAWETGILLLLAIRQVLVNDLAYRQLIEAYEQQETGEEAHAAEEDATGCVAG